MNAAPGWYLDPQDPGVEQYFNGTSFVPGKRLATAGTPPFPAPGQPVVRPPGADGPPSGARLAYTLAVFAALGGVIGGFALIAHTRRAACIGACDAARHPYIGAGIGTLLGGLALTVLLVVAGLLDILLVELRHQERQ